MQMIRTFPGLAAFTVAYMLAFGVWTAIAGNIEFVFYWLVMAILIGAVMGADVRVRFSGGILWALSIWGLAHMCGGNVSIDESRGGVLYNLWLVEGRLKYDQLVHAYGFFVAALAAWQALARRLDTSKTRPGFGLAFLVMLAGMGFGALNEVVEFAATVNIPDTNVGGYHNTGWDLVFNLYGATLAAALVWWRGNHLTGREVHSD